MTAITATTWSYTCKTCAVIAAMFISLWNSIIYIGETTGRARAARELTRMGLTEEAKALMLELKEIQEEAVNIKKEMK